jgi:UDP-GlcNAc:undecaprenyl-phosphate GlcNAc-1-phosphate transferase
MNQYIPIIFASGLIAFLLAPILRKVAHVIGFVDQPAARKVHHVPVPLLGGLAIYVGIAVAFIISVPGSFRDTVGTLGGITIMLLLGLWDDRYGMSPLIKLIGQTLATGLLIWFGIMVKLFDNPIIDIPITLLWVIGIVNALNFMDNMDGLAAGIATVACFSFLVISIAEGLGTLAVLSAATLGACIGFLFYNFSPASMFMGDAGSMVLGFVLAVIGLQLEYQDVPRVVTWMIPITILGLPIFDTTLVVISRLRRGRPLYLGGKDHTSHRLVSIFKLSTPHAVFIMYIIAGVLGLIGLLLPDASVPQAQLLLVCLFTAGLISLLWLELKFEGDTSTPPGDNRPTS